MYPKQYIDFFDCYHNQEYWEAHEVLEEIWQTQRHNKFYHGLIQIAAIMHQLTKGKLLGMRKLSTSAITYLTPFLPSKDGVDLVIVLAWLEDCLTKIKDLPDIMPIAEVSKLQIKICPLPKLK